MKERIISQLHQLSIGSDRAFADTIASITGYSHPEVKSRAVITLGAILRDYSSFSVSTIDRFFQRIVRSFFRELGLDISYEVLIDQKRVQSDAIEAMVERSVEDRDLARQIWRIVNSQIEKGKKINFQRDLGKIFSSAIDAGFYANHSVEIGEIENLYQELQQIYDQTKQSIVELCSEAWELITDNGISLSDFKYGKGSFANYFKQISQSSVIKSPAKRFRAIAESQNPNDAVPKGKGKAELLAILPHIMEITTAVISLYDSSESMMMTFEAISTNFARYTVLRKLSEELDSILSQRGQLSIASTSSLIKRITEGSSVPFIFERLGTKYTTIFIDEFQDTSQSQWDGFLPLIQEAAAKSSRGAVLIIGDIKQAIYRWRGGDWRLLGGRVEEDLEGYTDSKTLTTSWRSDQRIIEFNNSVIRSVVDYGTSAILNFLEDASESISMDLETILADAYNDSQQSVAPHRVGTMRGYVEVSYLSRQEGLPWVVERIKELCTRYTPSRIGVLVRGKREGVMVADALTEHGIEFMSEEMLAVSSSLTVRFIVNTLIYSLYVDEIVLRAMEQYLGRVVEPEEVAKVAEFKMMNPLEAVEATISLFGIGDRELYYLQSLYNICYVVSRQGGTIASFLEQWDGGLKDSSVALPHSNSAVVIMTIHKAKGLEFDAVVVPFADWDLYPQSKQYMWLSSEISPYSHFGLYPICYTQNISKSVYADDYYREGVSSVVDNVNLLYVALTRARTELYIGLGDYSTATKITNIGKLLYPALRDMLGGELTFGNKDSSVSRSEIPQQSSSALNLLEFKSYSAPELKIIEEEEVDEYFEPPV